MRIEVMTTISAVRFEECFAERVVDSIDGVAVNLISLNHLKINRRPAAGTRISTISKTCLEPKGLVSTRAKSLWRAAARRPRPLAPAHKGRGNGSRLGLTRRGMDQGPSGAGATG